MKPDSTPPCTDSDCESSAAFRLYDPPAGRWRAICQRHAETVHPSLEIHALLESGYLRPVELAVPDRSPDEPPTGRGRAFRAAVEELMGWSG